MTYCDRSLTPRLMHPDRMGTSTDGRVLGLTHTWHADGANVTPRSARADGDKGTAGHHAEHVQHSLCILDSDTRFRRDVPPYQTDTLDTSGMSAVGRSEDAS